MSSIALHHAIPVKVAIASFIAELSPEYPPVRPSLVDIIGDLPFQVWERNQGFSPLEVVALVTGRDSEQSHGRTQAGKHGLEDISGRSHPPIQSAEKAANCN
jgi:hypothetical protein